ncbi:MAG: beta-lactamase family protein [Acidimicrobiia bacterium]|nr:beta-lactamase family protein [Acidimicrobiia bacterium]
MRDRLWIIGLAAILALRPLPAASPGKEDPAGAGLSAPRLARIPAGMKRYIDSGQVAGTVTLVARRGRLVHLDAQGFLNLESKKPMESSALFRIASMTKPITSVAVMTLLEQGYFQLTDPVSKFIPDFKNARVTVPTAPGEAATPSKLVAAEREITIQHLLTHAAGLPNTYSGPGLPLFQKLVAERTPSTTVGEFTRKLAKLPLNFQPGTAWEYGPATDVLGHLVEVVSGESFDRYLARHIFEPLGMKDTFFWVPDDQLPRLATLYAPGEANRATPASAQSRGSKTFFSGGGGLISTASDYYLFCQMLLNGGELNGKRILSRKSIELMTRNHIGDARMWPTLNGNRFGLGFRVLTDLGQAAHLGSVGSYGWGGAFATYFWIDPAEQMIGILMTQIRPYTHLNIRADFQTLATQAVVD